jgi:hypothetical protein
MAHRRRNAALVALAGFLAASRGAAQEGQESITLSRTPMGLSAGNAPDFDVTVAGDGQVTIVRRTLIPATARTGIKLSESVERYRVTPADAAAFRSALTSRKPADESPRTICGGKTYSEPIVIRVPVFGIVWKGKGATHSQYACYLPQEAAIVGAIEAALAAVHLRLAGTRL